MEKKEKTFRAILPGTFKVFCLRQNTCKTRIQKFTYSSCYTEEKRRRENDHMYLKIIMLNFNKVFNADQQPFPSCKKILTTNSTNFLQQWPRTNILIIFFC